MTDKVRRRLVYKYTAIIAVMLLFFAVGGFAMCKYAVQKVIADTMYDAVAAEIREAEDAGVNENTPLKEMSAASDIGSIYSYAYWFAGDRLVFAEHPKDPAVDAVCRQKIAEPFADNKLQYFSLDDNRGRRWQFYMLAGRDGDRRVVILVNVTPFKLLSLRYIYLLLGALLLMLTVAWTGMLQSQPPKTYISVRPERYSHHLIQESGQFAINLPTEALVRSVDWCGVKSGRDVDKFAACGLHSAPGSVLTDCPILEESPVNLECKVTQVIPLGSHDLFLAEVAACDVDESLLDESGKLCLEKAKLIVYSHGDYLALGKKLGTFGYSVRKKKPVRRKK